MSIELVMPFNHLILCCPLLLMSSIFPSIRAFSNELPLHTRWPNYWSFNFSISPMNIQGWFPLGLIGLNSFKLVFWRRNLRYDHTTMRKNWKKNPRTLGDNYMWSKGTLKDIILVKLVLWFETMHIQFSSVAQLCSTLCDPMNRSTPGLPVHHQLPEFNQTHVHRVGDAIQPSHPLLSPFPPAPIRSDQKKKLKRQGGNFSGKKSLL